MNVKILGKVYFFKVLVVDYCNLNNGVFKLVVRVNRFFLS